MKSRIPFIVAVVGALLVGGATTGTTRASWSDSVTEVGDGITSGTMNFTLAAPSALPALTKTSGSEGTATFVATDTGTGRNLVQRITATVTSAPTGVTAYVAAGTTCAGITSTTTFLDKKPSDAVRTASYCVRVLSSTTAVSGNVTLSVTGAQRPSGWSVAAKTVTIPVTVNAVGAAVPVLTCQATQSSPDARIFSWPSQGAGVTYQIYRKLPAESTYTALGAASTATSFTENTLPKDGTFNYRVRAIKDGVQSADSSTVTISRNGNSDNYNCSVATP